jgi:valyl-tRNA synthetase
LTGIQKRLNNESFLDKAPDEVIAKVKAQHDELAEKQEKISTNLERIRSLA